MMGIRVLECTLKSDRMDIISDNRFHFNVLRSVLVGMLNWRVIITVMMNVSIILMMIRLGYAQIAVQSNINIRFHYLDHNVFQVVIMDNIFMLMMIEMLKCVLLVVIITGITIILKLESVLRIIHVKIL